MSPHGVLSYEEMLEHLYSFRTRGVRFGLKNIRLCLERLGRPQDSFLTVHVGGTKGKGSTSASLHHILTAAGHRSGLYTSPHLVDFRERFIVGRETVPRGDLIGAYRAVADATRNGEDPPLTFFEWVTAMAMLVFAARGVRVAVLETGMGGRLDATRAASGRLALISRIGLDHQEYLGETVVEIAGEKAGLIGRGSRVVTAPQSREVMEVLRKKAAVMSARLISLGEAGRLDIHGTDLAGVTFDLMAMGRRLPRLHLPLPGRHQAVNAALAVLGAITMDDDGLAVDDEAIYRGLSGVVWPGRLQAVGERPTIILDAAHNVDSMLSLAAFLRDVFRGVKITMVLGALADKDHRGILHTLRPLGPRLLIAPCASERTADTGRLAGMATDSGLEVEGVYPSVAAALNRAESLSGDAGQVVVTGSLFTVGEAMIFLEEKGRLRRHI